MSLADQGQSSHPLPKYTQTNTQNAHTTTLLVTDPSLLDSTPGSHPHPFAPGPLPATLAAYWYCWERRGRIVDPPAPVFFGWILSNFSSCMTRTMRATVILAKGGGYNLRWNKIRNGTDFNGCTRLTRVLNVRYVRLAERWKRRQFAAILFFVWHFSKKLMSLLWKTLEDLPAMFGECKSACWGQNLICQSSYA